MVAGQIQEQHGGHVTWGGDATQSHIRSIQYLYVVRTVFQVGKAVVSVFFYEQGPQRAHFLVLALGLITPSIIGSITIMKSSAREYFLRIKIV